MNKKKSTYAAPDFGFIHGDFKSIATANVKARTWVLEQLGKIVVALQEYTQCPLQLNLNHAENPAGYIIGDGVNVYVSLVGGMARADKPNRLHLSGLILNPYPVTLAGSEPVGGIVKMSVDMQDEPEAIAGKIWNQFFPDYITWLGIQETKIEAHKKQLRQDDITRNRLELTGTVELFRVPQSSPGDVKSLETKIKLRPLGVKYKGADPHTYGTVTIKQDPAMDTGNRASLELSGMPVDAIEDVLHFLAEKGWIK